MWSTRLVIVLILFMIGGLLPAQVNIYPVAGSARKPERNGVFFALPRTVVKITVTLREVETLRGPYAEYAQQLMGISGPVMQNTKEFDLADIRFETLAEPDPEHFYFMEVDEKTTKDERNISISITANGILRAVNSLSGSREQRIQQEEYKMLTDPRLFDFSASASLYRKVDTVIRVVTVDTATVRKRFFNTTFEEKPTEVKAREAADMVSRLRESRFNLLTGYQETSFSRETIEYMNKNLQKMEDEYISLFRGVRAERLLSFTYYMVPDENKLNQVVCRISKEAGILEPGDSKGREVVLVARRSGVVAKTPAWAPKPAETKATVIPYRIPDMVQLSVRFSGKTYDERYLPLPQFGIVSQMPFLKNRIEFDPQTGGIRSVLFE